MQISFAQTIFLLATIICNVTNAFAPVRLSAQLRNVKAPLHMSEENQATEPAAATEEEESFVDAATKLQLEKQKRADELRAQEVFMKRSTGIHKCKTCDWEFDEKKGDAFLIGGTVQPGTPFSEVPSNWRCPTCRASKDNFVEVTEEIPGFEVNQGYGFGGNSMTSGQKSGLVFGGLFVFFLLFLGGYGLS